MPDAVPVDPAQKDVLLGDLLERAMDQLPEGMRQVLILHDVEGYTHEEIGDFLGVTSGTSKSQLFKARAKMRDILRPFQGDGADSTNGVEAWGI
jgi:RNA polymerase sigma-70 factor (ECF subfamily)